MEVESSFSGSPKEESKLKKKISKFLGARIMTRYCKAHKSPQTEARKCSLFRSKRLVGATLAKLTAIYDGGSTSIVAMTTATIATDNDSECAVF